MDGAGIAGFIGALVIGGLVHAAGIAGSQVIVSCIPVILPMLLVFVLALLVGLVQAFGMVLLFV